MNVILLVPTRMASVWITQTQPVRYYIFILVHLDLDIAQLFLGKKTLGNNH